MSNLGERVRTGGPGRPKGCVGWKTKALQLIGEVYKEREEEARDYLLNLKMDKLLKEFIVPFMPKDLKVDIDIPNGINVNTGLEGIDSENLVRVIERISEPE